MKTPSFRQISFTGKAAWYLIKTPFILTYKLSRLIRKIIGGWILKMNDSFQCSGCGEKISLVGRWECGWCGYVFDGFFLRAARYAALSRPTLSARPAGLELRILLTEGDFNERQK